MTKLLNKAKKGFNTLKISQTYIKNALQFLEEWLTKSEFKDYFQQIEHLILNQAWDYLLDSFYQVIPFGTGGRRGEVGIGPNKINPWTIQASAQGHSQYLLKKYGQEAKKRGVVFAYDVRKFLGNKYLNDHLQNPVKNLTSKDLAKAGAKVYAANGIKVHFFDEIRTTPELSFAIRHLKAVAGDMFSASHNPPNYNGKKVYDQFGGQLIPPNDEELVIEVTQNVKKIKQMPYQEAVNKGLICKIGSKLDQEYIKTASKLSLSPARGIKIIYTPLHGCGLTSVYKTLKYLGFQVTKDPQTSNPSGKFENVTFNIPNPEVIQSFDTTLKFARQKHADIILSSDPDADRIGIMVKHKQKWIFLNGNEIAVVLLEYAIQKTKNKRAEHRKGIVIKTTVTTSLIKKICSKNRLKLKGDLLIGFKYIASWMNSLEKQERIEEFLLGCEESHGYLSGNYARDKDAVVPALWLSELSAELKQKGQTIVDYLNQIYAKYGYFKNYLTEIRLLGASGKEKISRIQKSLRNNPPKSFRKFQVKNFKDCLNQKPIVSNTDKAAKDVLIFDLCPTQEAETIKVTIRPSGTEPKIKMYFEIGTAPVPLAKLRQTKHKIENLLHSIEESVMQTCYKLINIRFPKRGFLLFWQLPLDDKMKYFKVEPEIEQLRKLSNKTERKKKLYDLISFLGSNPVEKIDPAFKAKYKLPLLKYLKLQ